LLRFVVLALLLPQLAGCVEQDAARREAKAAAEIADHGGPLEEQIAHMDRAIELAPERAIYWETRAGLYMSLCDNVRALADIDQAVKLADRPFLRFRRGLVLCRSGRFAEAVPEFDLAIAQQPENSQFYRSRALALLALGEAEAAEEDTRVLFSLDPNRIYNFFVRGAVLMELGRYHQAISDLDRAVEEQSDAFYVFRARAHCLDQLGKTRRAAADRRRADTLERDNGPDHGCNPGTTPYH
jgi:superkiller protein 3